MICTIVSGVVFYIKISLDYEIVTSICVGITRQMFEYDLMFKRSKIANNLDRSKEVVGRRLKIVLV